MSEIMLDVIFHGMCTFVPDCENHRMWVFLVKGDVDEQNAKGVPLHASFVRFAADQLSREAPGNVLWRLDQCHVEINPVCDDSLTIAGFGWKAPGCCTCDGQLPIEECFSWVAPVEDACAARGYPGGGVLDLRLTEPRLTENDTLLLGARFLLMRLYNPEMANCWFPAFGHLEVTWR
jgi:hypothetical protein